MYSLTNPYVDLAGVFQALGQPARLRILMALAEREACVCHLEAVLDLRQAYLSQQLMVLRQTGLVNQRREGKHVYYSLASPAITGLIEQAAAVQGFPAPQPVSSPVLPIPGCACPECVQTSELIPTKG